MSHYFYDDAFDFVSNDSNFGYIIEKGNGNTSANPTVADDEFVVEVHYLGDAITTVNIDVTNIDHSGSLNDLYYVPKGFIGTNMAATADGHRYGEDGKFSVSLNTDLNTAFTSQIVQNGTSPADTYWSGAQGGLDPMYGLVEIHIPATLTHEQQIAGGNDHGRDHDYLQMEAGLYFDVIQQDPNLVASLQEVIVGQATLSDFASDLNTATSSFASSPTYGLDDASNDTDGTNINEIPHMIHFDHVHYNAYDDFSVAPTQLNTAKTMNSYSEATLIGEFRIDEASTGEWSFDANMEVYLNNNTRAYSNPLYVGDGSTTYETAFVYLGSAIKAAGASNALFDNLYYAASPIYGGSNFIGYEIQKAAYDSTNSSWSLDSSSQPELLTLTAGTVTTTTLDGQTKQGSFNYDRPMTYDLNESFINTTASNTNITDIKTTFTRNDAGQLTITETLDPIDTLAEKSSIEIHSSLTLGTQNIAGGIYELNYYNYGGPASFYLQGYNYEGTNAGGGTEIFSYNASFYNLTEGNTSTESGFEDLVNLINNDSANITIAAPKTMLYSDLSQQPFVINIHDYANSYYYDDAGNKSTSKLDTGPYLVNATSPNDVTLTKIVADTDYDGIQELSTSYKLHMDYGWNQLEQDINTKAVTTENRAYESADQVKFKIEELGETWNSVDLTQSYMDVNDSSVPHGHYKVSYDTNTTTVTLQKTTFLDPEYDVTNDIYVLNATSSTQFVDAVNRNNQTVTQAEYKQYFYDLVNTETVDPNETITYATEYVTLNNGTIHVDGQAFDNTKINFINTANVTGTEPLLAGNEEDLIAGGVGGFTIDGGSGLDIYMSTPTTLKIVKDQNDNIIEEGGVKVDLSADRVIYLNSGAEDIVSNIEFFMGTLGDDQFIGSALHSTNIDATYKYDIQAFNPTAGKDEIFGAETVDDINNPGQVIDVQTVVTYDGMQGGQGAIFIMDGSAAATYAAEGAGEISLAKVNEFAGEYWNDTSWAGDGWLPSNDDILNDNGHLSTVSKYEVDKQGGTLILDTFGDTDLAFNVDHYIGSGEADIFFGSTGDDSFDAATGIGNYMSGGAGIDQLVVSDQNELEAKDGGGTQDSGEDIDLDSITVNRLLDYTYTNQRDVEYDSGTTNLIIDGAPSHTGETSYRIDFADVSNLSDFYESNLATAVSDLYTVSTEYALFIRTTENLDTFASTNTNFTFDTANQKLDVSGTDISVLNQISGQLVLAQENAVIEGYTVEGVDNDGNAYNTVIKDVEQVSLLSDDATYFGTGEISGAQEDIYQLIVGGQGDLGEMLYVETGETLNSSTGVGAYSASSNFINGEIYYSGHHTDFDRNTTNPSQWANSVASAFVVSGQDTAKIWNNEVAQFFVWYDADTTDNIDGYEIAVKFQNGNINAWGIDNRQFDTFQNVTVDQSLANAIKTEFGDSVNVDLGEYRILYEAAYTDIETLISSDADVTNWNFDFTPTSGRSTFYIQVGGDATGENGSAGIVDNLVTNVKVERVEVNGQYEWLVNPQAEILVNLPTLAGATADDNLMISGNSAETIEGGRGSDVMMGRGGSDNYKINAGDTLGDDGSAVVGSYGVAGDVINEIGGSSEDKSDAITLSSAKSVDELTFSRTEIASEYWGNTLKIDVAYTGGGTDTLFVFDHYNQNLESRAVEQLFLDDGWDSNEIWNLIVGDMNGNTGVDEYIGTAGQDVLIAGTEKSTLYGGTGQDVMIGDNYSKETVFELGNRDGAWDQVADIIQGFGTGDKLDLSALGITAKEEIQVSGNELQVASDSTVIAEFSNFNDSLTIDQLLTEEGAIIYAS